MNKIFLGFHFQQFLENEILQIRKNGFLYIGDELPPVPKARTFDVTLHSLNPLKDIDYRKARELADVLYMISPQGENTLTVRDGKRALLQAFLAHDRLDKIHSNKKEDKETTAMIADLLASPVLKHVLCNPTNFSFNPKSVVLVRLNRAELGDFDCLVVALILINHFKGQIIVPDGGFYLRPAHVSLIREERLIAGLNTLDQVPLPLRQALLSIEDKEPHGVLYDDAETLARYAGLRPDPMREDSKWNNFIAEAMG